MKDVHRRFITNWLLSDKPEAPLLLASINNEVLKKAITEIAQQGVCENQSVREGGCGECRQCKMAQEWTHPEVVIVNRDGGKIKISEVREANNKLSRTTYSARRILVINQADQLSLAASNALLKCLEEGTKKVRFVLSVKSPLALIETIRSRCVLISLVYDVSEQRLDEDGDQTMATIFSQLREMLKEEGPSEDLKRGYLRLRDYFLINSLGGNVKLAKEVLLASLPDKIDVKG
jgi:DNA polymerase III delta prime subunit